MTIRLYSNIIQNLTNRLWNAQYLGSFFTLVEESVTKAFGNRIRSLRKEKGWTQEYLAEITDLHPTYIGRVERGERNLSLSNISVLADSFDLSLKELFDY